MAPSDVPFPVLDLTQAETPTDAFMQYGAVGVCLLLALVAIRHLFNRQEQQHAKDIEYREKREQAAEARAQKAEQQLLELHELIRDRLVVELTRATDAASRAAELLGRREGDR